MKKEWFRNNWKMQFKEDAPAEIPAGGSGGNTPPPVEAPPVAPPVEAPPVAPPVNKAPEIDTAEFQRLKEENQRYTEQMARISQHVEIDANGEIKLKGQSSPKLTPEEQTMRTVQLVQAAQKEEINAAENFKSDPLFSKIFPKAREYVQRLSPDKQTSVAWQNAYALAAGNKEIMAEREKLVEQRAYERAKAEVLKQMNGAVPSGSGDKKGEEFNADNMTLTQDQLDAANKMIRAKMIPDLKTYKRNLWKIEQRNKGVKV